MMSNAGDLSKINCSSLTNSDLVSRYLAATPSYLYNVPPTQHNFFFSEMLRSFVKTKSDSVLLHTSSIQRRKRSWKEFRDRPVEFTTNERYKSHHIATQNPEYEHEFQSNYVQQQQSLFQNHPLLQENQFKKSITEIKNKANSHITSSVTQAIDEIMIEKLNSSKSVFDNYLMKNTEKGKTCIIDKKSLYLSKKTSIFPQVEEAVTADTSHANNRATYLENNFFQCCTNLPCDNLFSIKLKNKIDKTQQKYFSSLSGKSDEVSYIQDFPVVDKTTSDMSQSPLWYSPYSSTQNYSALDPLHFFIDLRVSRHIWDRKCNHKPIFTKNKHHSAFSLPQPKQYNVPLNLTRGKSMITKFTGENMKGTHYILKNIKHTYKTIANSENLSINDVINKGLDNVDTAQGKTNLYTIKFSIFRF